MAMAGKTERASPFTVLAEELDSTARAELRPELVAWAPDLSEFQARTARQIPVFMLTRQDRAAATAKPIAQICAASRVEPPLPLAAQAVRRSVIRRSSCRWPLSAVPATGPMDGQPAVYLYIAALEVKVLKKPHRVRHRGGDADRGSRRRG